MEPIGQFDEVAKQEFNTTLCYDEAWSKIFANNSLIASVNF